TSGRTSRAFAGRWPPSTAMRPSRCSPSSSGSTPPSPPPATRRRPIPPMASPPTPGSTSRGSGTSSRCGPSWRARAGVGSRPRSATTTSSTPGARSPRRARSPIAVGVISDTHGLLRPEALAALAGVAHIVHAGDIGAPAVLDQLGRLAPVTAVRGNNDRDAWAATVPETAVVELGGAALYVLHDRKALDLDPRAAGFAAVISGHSHQPGQDRRAGVLYFNPGSAGPRRFRLPVSVGRLTIARGAVRGRLITLVIA